MKRYLLFLLLLLAASPGWARPRVETANNLSRTQNYAITFTIGDTSDSEAIAVSGFCSVRYQQSSGDDASLYAVTTATTAASSGTLIGAFTASTTTATTFTAGTRWVKAVATDATAGGSVMTIDCAPLTGGGGGAVNVAYDSDDDGSPDAVVVEGDYNRDGAVDLEDIYDAANALTDTGPKFIGVQGAFDSSAMDASNVSFWDPTNLIELDANTTMQCAPSARLYGPSLAWWKARGDAADPFASRMISNKVGDNNVHVLGCFIENTELLSPFDGDNGSDQDWTTSLFGGVHFSGCDDCSVVGNTVRGSPHSGIFITASSRVELDDNYVYGVGEAFNHRGAGTVATLSDGEPLGETSLNLSALPANCDVDDWILIELDATDPLSKDPASPRSLWAAGWVTSAADPVVIRRAGWSTGRNPGLPSAASSGNLVFCSEGDKHGIETYSEGGVVARNNRMTRNRVELVPNVALEIRGVSLANDDCENDSDVTCWHENTVIADNFATDVNQELIVVRGSRNAKIYNNSGTRTGGVTFTLSAQTCSEQFDSGDQDGKLECTINTHLSNNTIRDCRPNAGAKGAAGSCVRINAGHERVNWESSNLIDGTIGGGGYSILGDVANSSLFLRARNTAGPCFSDAVAGSGDPITRQLKVGVDFTDCGMETFSSDASPAVNIRASHTAPIIFDPATITRGSTSLIYVDPTTVNVTGPIFRNFDFDANWAGYSGTFATIAAAEASVECSNRYEGSWVIVADAASATDCTTGGGSTENRCRCDGSAFANVDPSATFNPIHLVPNSSEILDRFTLQNGTITNALTTLQEMVTMLGSGTITNMTIEGVTFRKGEEGMLTADSINGIREQTGAITNLTVNNLQFSGITTLYEGLEDGDFSKDSHVKTTVAPSGACVGGALWTDTDAAAGAVLSVCEGGTWGGL